MEGITKNDPQKLTSAGPDSHGIWSARLQWIVVILTVVNLLWVARRISPLFFPWDLTRMATITTGCEEEALFSIWRFTQGQPVYVDGTVPPYAISYFNWLFYWCYGLVAQAVLGLLQLKIAWLPIITRLTTLALTFGCVGATYGIIKQADLWPRNWKRASVIALCVLLFFNDLFQNWFVTTRPDVGALFCELMGLWFALRYLDRGRLLTLAAAVLWCYAAWAFKHNMVTVVTGFCLVLIAARRFREMSYVALGSALLYGLTFGVGGTLYRSSILSAQKHCALSLDHSQYVLKMAFDLTPHLAVIFAALVGTLFLRHALPWDSKRLLLGVSCAVSWILMFVTSAKHGADYNYLFGPSVLGALWLLHLHQAPKPARQSFAWPRLALPLALFAFAASAASNAVVYTNAWRKARAQQAAAAGQRSITRFPPAPSVLRESLASLPGPVLVTERRFNLPWIQLQAPHFVVAYSYPVDRKGGQSYEQGGLGGLIANKYFKTIAIPYSLSPNVHMAVANVLPGPEIDGQPLHGYELFHSDTYFTYFRPRSAEPGPPTSQIGQSMALR